MQVLITVLQRPRELLILLRISHCEVTSHQLALVVQRFGIDPLDYCFVMSLRLGIWQAT